MRRLSLIIGIPVILILLGCFLFFLEYEVAAPPGSPANIKIYRKSAFAGITRVVDSTTGETLFVYFPEYDRHVHPIKIEKIDERHWQVVFEKP